MAIWAILIAFPCSPARADEICSSKDDKASSKDIDDYVEGTLKEHASFPLTRKLKAQARERSRQFLVQNIVDKKAELCADRLRLAEEIKRAPAQYPTGDCAAAAVVTLIDDYMHKVARSYDGNLAKLASYQGEHLNEIKLWLFGVAKGSTAGLEGVAYKGMALAGAPKELRFEWVKQEATKLAGETHRAWGGVEASRHPLLRLNLAIAREAVRARSERDAQKARLRTDGKLAASCKKKVAANP